MNFQNALAYFTAHEGKVEHMYLDSRGLVTVGIGRMLPTPAAAQELPFVLRGTSAPASANIIALEWQAVLAQERDRLASYYRQCTVLDLPGAAMDADFARSVTSFSAVLRRHFPKFDSFPDPAQLGLLDMVYSEGEGVLFLPRPPGSPHFCAGALSEDWLLCAQECRRGGVSDARNADCAALFKSVVIPS